MPLILCVAGPLGSDWTAVPSDYGCLAHLPTIIRGILLSIACKGTDWNKGFAFLLLLCGDVSHNPGPDYSDLPLSSSTSPIFASANVNGLVSKLDDVRTLLHEHRLHVLAVQETKSGHKIMDREVDVDGFALFRKDRGSGRVWWGSGSLHCFDSASYFAKKG